MVRALVASGVILDPGMVYFDARLSTHHPTVEIRVPDVCLNPEHAVGIALAPCARHHGGRRRARRPLRQTQPPPRSCGSRCGRRAGSGLNQTLWDPNSRGPREARVVADALLRYVGVALRDSETRGGCGAAMTSILESGTGSEVQCQTLARTGSLAEVVEARSVARTRGA